MIYNNHNLSTKFKPLNHTSIQYNIKNNISIVRNVIQYCDDKYLVSLIITILLLNI